MLLSTCSVLAISTNGVQNVVTKMWVLARYSRGKCLDFSDLRYVCCGLLACCMYGEVKRRAGGVVWFGKHGG